jgi:hypothetical protein
VLRRILKLLHVGARPVLVFDGSAPALKQVQRAPHCALRGNLLIAVQATLRSRRFRRSKAETAMRLNVEKMLQKVPVQLRTLRVGLMLGRLLLLLLLLLLPVVVVLLLLWMMQRAPLFPCSRTAAPQYQLQSEKCCRR